MKIAILGANGFLGKFLCDKLGDSYTIIPVIRSTVNLLDFVEVDRWLAKETPEVVISCIANGGGARIDDVNYTDVQKDLAIFLNFYNSSHKFRYINIGSGAEFDRRQTIHMVKEEDILTRQPLESYGFAKNIISRLCLEKDNFYTLRLFGCFDISEPDIRLFKKFLAKKVFSINDKWFDYISADDFALIVEHYCLTDTPIHKDVNCVYEDKHLISEILHMVSKWHNSTLTVTQTQTTWTYYTGDGTKLKSLGLLLQGLEEGIKNYE